MVFWGRWADLPQSTDEPFQKYLEDSSGDETLEQTHGRICQIHHASTTELEENEKEEWDKEGNKRSSPGRT